MNVDVESSKDFVLVLPRQRNALTQTNGELPYVALNIPRNTQRTQRSRKLARKLAEQKIDFAHRLDALARLGHRELRADKISASYDAWRPPKH